MKSDNMTVDLSLFFVFGQEVFLKWKKKKHWTLLVPLVCLHTKAVTDNQQGQG